MNDLSERARRLHERAEQRAIERGGLVAQDMTKREFWESLDDVGRAFLTEIAQEMGPVQWLGATRRSEEEAP